MHLPVSYQRSFLDFCHSLTARTSPTNGPTSPTMIVLVTTLLACRIIGAFIKNLAARLPPPANRQIRRPRKTSTLAYTARARSWKCFRLRTRRRSNVFCSRAAVSRSCGLGRKRQIRPNLQLPLPASLSYTCRQRKTYCGCRHRGKRTDLARGNQLVAHLPACAIFGDNNTL
jgi:hypothetical protein